MEKLKKTNNILIKNLSLAYLWYKRHLPELIFISIAFVVTYLLKMVPYFSIVVGFIPSLPFIVAILLSLYLLRPRYRKVLYLIFLLIFLSLPFVVLKIYSVGEILTEIAYVLLFSIIVINIVKTFKSSEK